jgi:hypothetical protein
MYRTVVGQFPPSSLDLIVMELVLPTVGPPTSMMSRWCSEPMKWYQVIGIP